MTLDKTIRAIQSIAKPAVAKTQEVIDTWNREWNKDKPSSIAKPTTAEEDSGDVGICNICTGPYVDGHCQTYQCWR